MLFIVTNLYVFKTKKKNLAYLTFGKKRINCFVGKNGIGKKTREGDKITPRGVFKLLKVFYRQDRIGMPQIKIPKKRITKNSFWCVDSKNHLYNCYRQRANNLFHENLYREDNLYDILISCDYNVQPTKKFKGSAIFIHCSNDMTRYTEGCIAFEKKYFYEILRLIGPLSKLIVY